MKQLEKNSLLIIAGLVLFTIMFGIGGVPLLDPDEPVYAETAREMIQFNDFQEFLHKFTISYCRWIVKFFRAFCGIMTGFFKNRENPDPVVSSDRAGQKQQSTIERGSDGDSGRETSARANPWNRRISGKEPYKRGCQNY